MKRLKRRIKKMVDNRIIISVVIVVLVVFSVFIWKRSYDNVKEAKMFSKAQEENSYARFSIQDIYLSRLDGGNIISNSYGIGELWMVPAVNVNPATLETIITFSVISIDCRINYVFDNYEDMINKYNELSAEYSNIKIIKR